VAFPASGPNFEGQAAPPFVLRSTQYSSFPALTSVQLKSIWLDEIAVADRPVGAESGVVSMSVFE
jgi:hypothetical protein